MSKGLASGAALLLVALGCGKTPNAGIPADFPLFFVAGATLETGSLYKVEALTGGSAVTARLVRGGLVAPGGLAQDHAGNLYVAEALPEPEGRVLRLSPDGGAPVPVIVGLSYPTGVVLDTFNQIYAIENGRQRVTKLGATGELSGFKTTELASPESGVMDAQDALYLVEAGTSVVSRLAPTGERAVLTAEVPGLRATAVDATGAVHVLVVDADMATGKVYRVEGLDRLVVVTEDLVNPLALAFDGENALYVAEGAPAQRISRLGAGETTRRVIVTTEGEPRSLTFTP